jgi:hypothetical protein
MQNAESGCCARMTTVDFWYRYNPDKGLLTLTSEKYGEREENRLTIVEMLSELVKEGQRAYPSNTFKTDIDVIFEGREAQAITA